MLAVRAIRTYALGIMTDLRTALHAEAARFADRIHDLMIAQIAGVLGATSRAEPHALGLKPAAAPRERLSQDKIEEALARIIELLGTEPGGLRSEQIRVKLNMDKKLFQYAAHLGKTSDQLVQSGERRSTVYSLPVRPSKAQEDGRVVKRRKR